MWFTIGTRAVWCQVSDEAQRRDVARQGSEMDEYRMIIDRNMPGRESCISASAFIANSTSTVMNANKRGGGGEDAERDVCEPNFLTESVNI
jgi:hypothetical protein